MTRDHLERRLRTDPVPGEADYRPQPLPATVAEAHRQASGSRRPRSLTLLAAVAGTAVVAVSVAVAAGWLGGPTSPSVGTGPSTTPSPVATGASPSTAPTAACRAADFAVTSDPWDAGAGSRGTRVVLRVVDSVDECMLEGTLAARITDASGQLLVEAPSDASTPTTVAGGRQLEIGVAWSNWCGPAPAIPVEMSVTLPGDDVAIPLVPPAGTEILVPPCMGSGQASNLSVTAFEELLRTRPEG